MGRVAVITGVASGIGRATAQAFRAAGWDTIGIDRQLASGCAVDEFVQCDLESDDFGDLIEPVLHQAGPITALVNNAAIQIVQPLSETSADDWRRVQQVNVIAGALLLQRPLPHMQPGSAVVNVSSVHAVATSPGMAAYVASKGAVVALTRATALELAPRGIRVNCVLPGAIDTPMLREGLHRSGTTVEEARAALAGRTPLRRIGTPEDVAEAILFLADSEKAAFITGQSLIVDGGATARLSTE